MRYDRTILLTTLALFALPVLADDWPRFRGANGSGTSASTGLPIEFGPGKNQVWESDIPFGRSSPVIAGNRLFVTAVEDGEPVTIALDRRTGKTIWRSALKRARTAEFHQDTDSATTTPVTDGNNVYVFFQEVGLIAYDRNGKEQWRLDLGPFRNFYSIAASPVLSGNLIYMLCDQAEGSFLVAVNKKTGQEEWRQNRPARLESYSTPVLYPGTGKPEALLAYGSRWVDAYDAGTGKPLWSLGDLGSGPVSSPVVADDVLFVNAPNHAENGWAPFEPILEEHDANSNGELSREEVAEAWLAEHFGWLDHDASGAISAADWKAVASEMESDTWGTYAIRLPAGKGKPEVLWNYRKNISEIASPLVHDGIYYMVQDGIMTSLDVKTGELLKRDRLGEASGKIYASPIAADGKIFVGTLDGTMVVLRAGGQWETLASVDLGDEIWATPAIADGRLYVRTRGKLHSFGATGE